MGVLADTWCFCRGGGKSERMKASLLSTKASAIVRISAANSPQTISSTGFLIHRNLLLTSHTSLPTAAAAFDSDICLPHGLTATLFPHRFFITSSVLDLTIVGLDVQGGENTHLKTCQKPNLDLGSTVYLLGHTEEPEGEVAAGEGKVVVSTDGLVKLSTGTGWCPGSAGFDSHGNLAFMICYPMKLATSPNAKSSRTSSSPPSGKRGGRNDSHFGIPIPAICSWLYRHWEGSLDDPKLPHFRSTPALENSMGLSSRRLVLKSMTEEEEEEEDRGEREQTTGVHGKTVTQVASSTGENYVGRFGEVQMSEGRSDHGAEATTPSTGAVNGPESEESLCEDGEVSERETMYSAETAESRNYMSPRGGTGPRSHSRDGMGSQRRIDYYSPTVSSIMKKRESPEPVRKPPPPRRNGSGRHVSPRWVF